MTREELLKIAKPVLFNTEMVIAILEDRKGATRRIVKGCSIRPNQEINQNAQGRFELYDITPRCGIPKNVFFKPPYEAGDYLYVRETWNWYPIENDTKKSYIYRADFSDKQAEHGIWKPSIHMPKEAARIFLKVTDVRVERLQDIEDFKKEGLIDICEHCDTPTEFCDCCGGLEEDFIDLWDSTIKKADLDKYGWDASPWVWVIEFERVEV